MSHCRFRTRLIRLLAVTALAFSSPVAIRADGLPISAPNRTDAVRFQDEILPILAANCTACHNEKIHEGGLILDSLKAILTGGNSGPGVVAGNSGESPLFLRASHLEEDFMPPPENKVGT